jgi:hypothetical protein
VLDDTKGGRDLVVVLDLLVHVGIDLFGAPQGCSVCRP